MSPDQIAALATAAVAVLGLVGSWYRWGRPKWRRFWDRLDGTFDAINGRDAYVDTASGRNVPALPPLTTRVANVEEAIVLLTRIEERVTTVEGRTTYLETSLESHASAISELQKARTERMIAQAESAQMYRAMADHDPDLAPKRD